MAMTQDSMAAGRSTNGPSGSGRDIFAAMAGDMAPKAPKAPKTGSGNKPPQKGRRKTSEK